jgi:alpha-glucosidase (family GH31 glycosyl hydrolase)
MLNLPAQFKLELASSPDPEAVVQISAWRFTMLTARIIRIEYDSRQIFEDRPTQVVWYRRVPVPSYQKTFQDGVLEIKTDHLFLSCQVGLQPEESGLEIKLLAAGSIWRLGDQDPLNLSGTYRTLDRADGPLALEPGLISRSGWSVVDDTRSLVFNEQGWLEPRPGGGEVLDLYFLGYGSDYPACLDDYTQITGRTPLIPRWALGNWWSRFWEYSQDELTALMREFRQRNLPLSVCIVDTDWHITSTGNSSTGWTGYTWNTALFPDPQKFLDDLHQLGLHVALNLHPAEGIHPHEADYPQMARQMGIDPTSAQPVPFDLADPRFAQAYFEILHHPQEARGVDFWWLDWQQGALTKLPGLDPLWWLNHLHALDMARDGKKRPFIFSRWGGLGNHRYPIGFSGDTHVTWETLAFQPYFTATAANVAYGWWSHDIGGHMRGIEDSELYARWVQFGVLSPILRLHSTKNPYHERLPWKYDAETERLARSAMRFRYALIPYLYSMAWREHQTGAALVQPMYYAAPDQEESYHAPNQYLFGSQLIAAPFTGPRDEQTRMARQVVWLPEGRWFTFPGARMYEGGRWHAVYGGLEDTPIFARAGAILPLASDSAWNNWHAPDHLQVHVFPGASNHFDLYEDDGETTAYLSGSYSVTPFDLKWRSTSLEFRIGRVQGDTQCISEIRRFDLNFYNLAEEIEINATIDETEITPQVVREGVRLKISGMEVAIHETLVVKIQAKNGVLSQPRDARLSIYQEMIKTFHLETLAKTALSDMSDEIIVHPDGLGKVRVSLSDSQFRALSEVLCGFGFTRFTEDGGDRIVLWNPDQYPACTYQLSSEQYAHGVPDHYAYEGGQVPKFKVFDLTQPKFQTPWRFQVQYLNQLQMSINS